MGLDILKLQGMTLDEYELVNLIGKGGMSAVYRAHQEELSRYVAVKILSADLAEDPTYTERFTREAKMSASLEHPHIVPVYDFGTQDGLTFVVMRFLTGGTLGQKMKRGQPMPVNEVVRIVEATAKALDYAHKRGIIHRDVKPSNIMFDEEDTVYLVDFGIAKAVKSADIGLTSEQIVLGTPSYMSPEQWRGDMPTQAVDQYALAVITYQMLTGQPAFEASTPPEMMYKHMNDTPTPVNRINQTLSFNVNKVIDRALAKNAEDRYASLAAFSTDLKRALQQSGGDVTLKTPPVLGDSGAKATQESKVVVPSDGSDDPTLAPPVAAPSPSPVSMPPPVPSSHAQPTMPQARASGQQYTAPPRPPAQQYPPTDDRDMGQRTLMMRVAMGGGIGFVLVIIFLVMAVAGLIFVLNILGNDGSSPSGGAGQIVTESPSSVDIEGTRIAIETAIADNTQATPTDLPTSGAPTPTGLPLGGTSVPPVGQSTTLYSQLTEPVRDAEFAPNSAVMATGHGDGYVRAWLSGYGGSPTVLGQHSDVVYAIAWRPDGGAVASASADGTVNLWDVNARSVIRTFSGHAGAVRDVAFSPDGTMIATAGEDMTVRLWDASTGNIIRTFSGHTSRVFAVTFSPNGQFLASASEDQSIIVREVSTGNERVTLRGHNEGVRSLAFSSDGTMLASSSTDNTIRVWNWLTAETRYTLTGQSQDVWDVEFSPDGTILASGGRDNNMRLYSMTTGQQINVYTGHGGWVFSVDFSADGSLLLTASGDGTVRLWQVTQ